MKFKINKQHYLCATSLLASVAGVHVIANDEVGTSNSDTSRASGECSSHISANQNKVEIRNCDDINVDLITKNGTEIKIDAQGSGNTVIVDSTDKASASISQTGSGNTVIIKQTGASHKDATNQRLQKLMELRREHEKRVRQRRMERNKNIHK